MLVIFILWFFALILPFIPKISSTCVVSDCSACETPTATTCDTCQSGFFLTSSNSVCSPCVDPCSTCTSATACDLCLPQYKKVSTKCCPLFCNTCTDHLTCTACEATYTVRSSKCCTTECTACTNGGICSRCAAGELVLLPVRLLQSASVLIWW